MPPNPFAVDAAAGRHQHGRPRPSQASCSRYVLPQQIKGASVFAPLHQCLTLILLGSILMGCKAWQLGLLYCEGITHTAASPCSKLSSDSLLESSCSPPLMLRTGRSSGAMSPAGSAKKQKSYRMPALAAQHQAGPPGIGELGEGLGGASSCFTATGLY